MLLLDVEATGTDPLPGPDPETGAFGDRAAARRGAPPEGVLVSSSPSGEPLQKLSTRRTRQDGWRRLRESGVWWNTYESGGKPSGEIASTNPVG